MHWSTKIFIFLGAVIGIRVLIKAVGIDIDIPYLDDILDAFWAAVGRAARSFSSFLDSWA